MFGYEWRSDLLSETGERTALSEPWEVQTPTAFVRSVPVGGHQYSGMLGSCQAGSHISKTHFVKLKLKLV